MEDWKPDHSFEKADIPVRRPGQKKEKAKPPGGKAQPFDRGEKPPVNRGGDEATPGEEEAPGKKVVRPWVPGSSFGQADIPVRRPGEHQRPGTGIDTAGPQNPGESKPSSARERAASAFPGLFTDRKEAQPSDRLRSAHEPPAFVPRHIPRGGSKDDAGGDTLQPGAGRGLSEQMLREMVLTNVEDTRNLLRHWYWEKPGMGGALEHIHPHHRIFIILRSLGTQILQVVFQTMSPNERKQMVEILKQNRTAVQSEIAFVRQEFMKLMGGVA